MLEKGAFSLPVTEVCTAKCFKRDSVEGVTSREQCFPSASWTIILTNTERDSRGEHVTGFFAAEFERFSLTGRQNDLPNLLVKGIFKSLMEGIRE